MTELKDYGVVPWWSSKRLILALMVFLGYLNGCAQRVVMSVAIVCMVNQTGTEDSSLGTTDSGSCGGNFSSSSENTGGEFNWNKELQSYILGSFFWGYILTQFPGGFLSLRFGGKRVFGWFMFVLSMSTLLIPLAARVDPILIIVLRVITGIGQGVHGPATNYLWAHWAPPLERSRLIGFSNAGCHVGNVIGLSLAAYLCDQLGWPSVFYVFGGFGVFWFCTWMYITSNTPDEHPTIKDAEKYYIQETLSLVDTGGDTQIKIPWRQVWTSLPLWAIIVGQTCCNWGIYTYLTSMPMFLNDVLKIDIQANGLFSALPYILLWFWAIVAGFTADLIITKGFLNVTHTRKLFSILGGLLPAIFSSALGFVDCTQPVLVLFLMTLSTASLGSVYGGGLLINHVDIGGRFAPILFGITNTFATIPGFMSPYVIGYLTPNKTASEWRNVFFLCTGAYVFAFLFYAVFGSGELQDWAKKNYKEKTNDEYKKITDMSEHPS